MRMNLASLLLTIGLLFGLATLHAQPNSASNRVLRLDGQSGYVELPANIFNELSEATIEAWVRWDRLGPPGWNRVFNYGAGGRDVGIGNLGADGLWLVAATPETGLREVVASGALRLGEWVHVAAVLERSGMM